MVHRFAAVCLAGMMLITAVAARAAEDPVLLGAVYNLSGEWSAFDQPAARGAELAIAKANAAGGVLGRPVELVPADPAGSLDQVAARTRALIEANPSLSAVLGLSDTDMVLAAAPVAAEHQLVFMTSGATSPKLAAQVPEYLFLASFGDNVQAAAAAEFAYRELAARTVSIVYNSGRTYTTLLQGYFRTRFEELGGAVVAVASYPTTAEQGAALAEVVKADLVFLAAEEPAEAAAGVTGLRAAGVDVPILGGDGFDAGAEWAKHSEVNDVYFTTHAYLSPDSSDILVRAFDKAYQRAFGQAPSGFAALARLEGYRGVTGTIGYEGGSRIPRKSVTILEVRGGHLALVEQLMPERVPAP